MRLRSFSPGRVVVGSIFTALVVMAPSAGAQASTHVGMRIGYNFDSEEVVLSTNLTVPMTNRIEFYPSLDIYTPERGNKIGFNGDVKIGFPTTSGPHFYAGGGVGVVNRNVGDFSDTDVGVNLLAGIESKVGWIHPFAEGKVLLHDRSQFQLIGGLNLTLGR